MRKENFHIKSNHDHDLDNQSDNHFNELKNDIHEL